MITPEFLQACTPEQINKGVEWLKIKLEFKINRMNTLQFLLCNSRLITPKPYCTSPNDAMPIAFANNISIVFDVEPMAAIDICFDGPFCSVGLSSFNKNPLRAAMEVYLLMSNDK